MDYRIKLEEFEGPLDLLLQLIESQELDITAISLAQVTDQYLHFISQEEQLPADEIADFLVVASKLIYVKSKHLLPELWADEEEAQELEHQLKVYREYFEASKAVESMIHKKRFSYIRTMPYKLIAVPGFHPPKNVALADMSTFFERVLKNLEHIVNIPNIVLEKTVSIKTKILQLQEAVKRGLLRFHELYDRTNKNDAIVSFLALLELVKRSDIIVSQDEIFSEIMISEHSV